ncbi:DUF1566 domain-containing protein [Paraburkholderia tagetis]|uniref:DUF1566 domain-containing protein n=1 Tax=Paraburkholderia tagetis TaxID=2913261 RepID=A0A9X1RKN7_9BURK|nr:DUF1566 domain-containing protein [Paraburkholderia tagetis]MCG5072230.1 DUF1566 domain-containing protein [Paraburkholderia tagetis]
MTLTLEVLEEKQSELAGLIAQFKRQHETTVISIAAATMNLASGEAYAGILLGDDGKPSHHLILLPGDAEGSTWAAAKSWAAEHGGELPTRREQSLLFANLKQYFEKTWYWSAEEHESNAAFAWSQSFYDGLQYYDRKGDDGCRARAVRRLEIQ